MCGQFFLSAGVQQECKAKNKINNYYSCSYLTVTFSHSQHSCTVNLHQHCCWKIKPTLRVWVTHRSLDPRQSLQKFSKWERFPHFTLLLIRTVLDAVHLKKTCQSLYLLRSCSNLRIDSISLGKPLKFIVCLVCLTSPSVLHLDKQLDYVTVLSQITSLARLHY